jgi:hypothetical protein
MNYDHQITCPVNARPFKKCPCEQFSKDGLCDWPYPTGADYEQVKDITEKEVANEQS